MEPATAQQQRQQLVAAADQVAGSGDEAGRSPLPLAPPPPRLRAASSLWNLHHHAHETPPRLVRNRSSEMRSQRAPLPRELARYRADSLPAEPRLSVCSTSGMVYESVVVVGHTFGSDRVVYYLLEVRSWERPLEGYVVRRRYTDFKRFHQELSKHMPESTKPRSSSYGGFGLYYSSLLCSPLVGGGDADGSDPMAELHPLWSPKRSSDDDGASTRKNTHDSDAADGELALESPDERTLSPPSPPMYNDDNDDDDAASSAWRPSLPESWTESLVTSPAVSARVEYAVPPAATQPGQTYYDSNLTLPLDRVKFTMADRAILPELPSGGVAALLSTQQALIKYRVEQFNAILAAVMSDSSPAVATLLMNFIQEKPGGQVTSYTSLSEYAAIEIPWRVERYARRRAMSMGRRPPTLSREVSSSSSVSTHSGSGGGTGTVVVTPPAISAA